MNKSGHQVLTIKAIHYPTMPRDCIREILLGVKDGESRGEENHGQWFRQNTLRCVTWQQHIKAAIKLQFHCIEPKSARASSAKVVFNCKGESRGEKKKKRWSTLSVVSHKRTVVGQVQVCQYWVHLRAYTYFIL